MAKIGTPGGIGEFNKKLILNHLRLHGARSRADLARETGMSFPAVSSNVVRLLNGGYINEAGSGGNSFGRKARLLSFNARRGYVIGIDIGRRAIRHMLADLLGTTLGEKICESESGADGSRMIGTIVRIAGKMVREAGIGDKDVLAICVGIPGIMRDGRMFAAPFIADFSLDELRGRLERRFGAAVLIENGVNLGAIGEHWRGVGAKYSDLIYISYGVGLGSALILNGRLYPGTEGAAGEIGFMLVDPAGVRARFSEIGVLENAITPSRVERRLAGRSDFAADMEGMLQHYREGRAEDSGVVREISLYFGMALVNICAVVNPQAIILSGGMGRILGGYFGEFWANMLVHHLPFAPELLFSELEGRESVLGAISAAMEYVNKSPIA